VLLIADEVMSGIGRTGRFFGMDHFGVTPDIITLSKGISSGYFPLAAVIVTSEVFEAIKNAGTGEFVHGFTYAGTPIGAAIGLEVLDILEEDQLVPRVAVLGERLLAALEPLKQFPMVGDIRGRGLLVGIELVMDRPTREPFPASARVGQLVLQACLDEGLAVYPSTGSVNGVLGENILLAPPYIITETQLGELVDKLTRAIDRVQHHLLEAAETPAAVG
jgi:adenosylmethionine-8-amino-7-oxononanoate aminotransferase